MPRTMNLGLFLKRLLTFLFLFMSLLQSTFASDSRTEDRGPRKLQIYIDRDLSHKQQPLICGFCRTDLGDEVVISCGSLEHGKVHERCARSGAYAPSCPTLGCQNHLEFKIEVPELPQDQDKAFEILKEEAKGLEKLADRILNLEKQIKYADLSESDFIEVNRNKLAVLELELRQRLGLAKQIDYSFLFRMSAQEKKIYIRRLSAILIAGSLAFISTVTRVPGHDDVAMLATIGSIITTFFAIGVTETNKTFDQPRFNTFKSGSYYEVLLRHAGLHYGEALQPRLRDIVQDKPCTIQLKPNKEQNLKET